MNSICDNIYFKDKESRFIQVSKGMASTFNLSDASGAVGKTDFDFFTEEHARPAYEDEQKILETRQPIIGQIEKETWPDGSVTWVSTTKMPLFNRDGDLIGTWGISRDVTARREAEAEIERINKQLILTSRQAGMAEVATGVLHNVGNILNTANLATTIISESVQKSKISALSKVVEMFEANQDNLTDFLANDPRGKQLPLFIKKLTEHLIEEQLKITEEVQTLAESIEHIKEIVTLQQDYAVISGLVEPLAINDLIEDALRIHCGAFTRHGVKLEREIGDCPTIVTDKHKILQILVNLLHNAKYACDYEGNELKKITIRTRCDADYVSIDIIDTGIGIPEENLTKIFGHGFTTRKDGHGFGLHSSSNSANDIGGSLAVRSDGTGTGATFTLNIPIKRNDPLKHELTKES